MKYLNNVIKNKNNNIITPFTGSDAYDFYNWHEIYIKNLKNTKKRKLYFTQENENAIVAYNNTDNNTENIQIKNKLYNDFINYPFKKIAENIIHTFKFYYFQEPPVEVQHAVVTHLIDKIHMYKKDKGKAFSYFSVMAKNYLIYNNTNNYEKIYKKLVKLDDIDHDIPNDFAINERKDTKSEFMELFIKHCYSNLDTLFVNSRDKNIADAILIIFKQRENIEEYNKKALYLMIREMTNAKTQQITRVIKQIKKIYFELYTNFEKTGFLKNK